MRKKSFLLTVVLVFSFVILASAADLSQLFEQVKSGLLQKGVAAADVSAIQPAATSLLGAGVSKNSLMSIVTNLVAMKVSGNTLNSPLQAMGGLIQSGQQPGIASNLMSMVIDQAKAQGLTGNAAVSKITDFINQKKADFLSMKQQAQAKVQAQKDKLNNWLGSVQKK